MLHMCSNDPNDMRVEHEALLHLREFTRRNFVERTLEHKDKYKNLYATESRVTSERKSKDSDGQQQAVEKEQSQQDENCLGSEGPDTLCELEQRTNTNDTRIDQLWQNYENPYSKAAHEQITSIREEHMDQVGNHEEIQDTTRQQTTIQT